MSSAELPPVEEVVPHRGEMLLLDRVLAHDGQSTTAGVAVGSSGWLERGDGRPPSWLALEYMAQCVAAHEGMLALAEGRPLPLGFLVAAHELRLDAPHFTAGERLRVWARRAGGRPGLGALSHVCTLHADEPGLGAVVDRFLEERGLP